MLDLISCMAFSLAKVCLGLFIGCIVLAFVYYGALVIIVDPVYYIINKKHLKSWYDLWEEVQDVWLQR